MTKEAKSLIKAAHGLLGKTNTGDFDSITQIDAVVKAMRLLSSVLEEPNLPEWDDFCSRQGSYMRFDNQGKKTGDESYEVVKACCFTPKHIKEPWDNWRPCCYDTCEFLKGRSYT